MLFLIKKKAKWKKKKLSIGKLIFYSSWLASSLVPCVNYFAHLISVSIKWWCLNMHDENFFFFYSWVNSPDLSDLLFLHSSTPHHSTHPEKKQTKKNLFLTSFSQLHYNLQGSLICCSSLCYPLNVSFYRLKYWKTALNCPLSSLSLYCFIVCFFLNLYFIFIFYCWVSRHYFGV